MHLISVPPEAVDTIWPQAEPHIARACEHSHGMHTAETVFAQVKHGGRQLWIIVNDAQPREVTAAGVTSLQGCPTGKKFLQIEVLGGKNVKEWFDLKPQLEKWAKDEGCSAVQAWARKGWAKHLPDYGIAQYVMYKEI